MAEFKTIMNGWKDICERYHGCIDCPIKACDEWYDMIMSMDEKTIKSIEDDVIATCPAWIEHSDSNSPYTYYDCSVCGFKSEVQYKHCPDCGRKMLLK